MGGIEGRGVLRRQFAKDYTQPCVQLPTYPEEEEPNLSSTLVEIEAIRPPPGYRDPSPIPSSNMSLPCSPLPASVSHSPSIFSPNPFLPSPFSFSNFSVYARPMSPLPPPPSPFYSSVPSSSFATLREKSV